MSGNNHVSDEPHSSWLSKWTVESFCCHILSYMIVKHSYCTLFCSHSCQK